jgi:nitrite reductase/ring-hydroxylating ferredoxin subunit
MSEKISRKEFLEKGAQAALVIAGITACGRLLTGEAFAAGEGAVCKVGSDRSLLTVDELKKQGAVSFMNNGRKSILLFIDGEIRAYENICTHKGGPTKLAGKKLVCLWHGASFDPLSGESTKSPAPKGSKLTVIKLEIKEGKIYLA